jgi:addiction module RelB/DinJ family antitoxin
MTTQDTELHIRIDKELKAKVYKAAQKMGLSISSYIRYVLKKDVGK